MAWFKKTPEPMLVRLHLVDGGPSFEGVLLGEPAGHYRLANATVLDVVEPVQMDGEAWVLKTRVLFLQVLT